MIQKKLKSLLCAGLGLILCVLLCGGIGMTAQAAESKTYNGFTYEKGKDGITITGYTGGETAVVIPAKIKGTQVTKIGKNAFLYSNMTSVKMPEGLKTIEYQAFAGCNGLTSVTVPDSVTSIVGGAFGGCSSLTSLILPDGLTSIGGSAFSGCSSLTDITLPNGIKSIRKRRNFPFLLL